MNTCQLWLLGRCEEGNACQFSHHGPNPTFNPGHGMPSFASALDMKTDPVLLAQQLAIKTMGQESQTNQQSMVGLQPQQLPIPLMLPSQPGFFLGPGPVPVNSPMLMQIQQACQPPRRVSRFDVSPLQDPPGQMTIAAPVMVGMNPAGMPVAGPLQYQQPPVSQVQPWQGSVNPAMQMIQGHKNRFGAEKRQKHDDSQISSKKSRSSKKKGKSLHFDLIDNFVDGLLAGEQPEDIERRSLEKDFDGIDNKDFVDKLMSGEQPKIIQPEDRSKKKTISIQKLILPPKKEKSKQLKPEATETRSHTRKPEDDGMDLDEKAEEFYCGDVFEYGHKKADFVPDSRKESEDRDFGNRKMLLEDAEFRNRDSLAQDFHSSQLMGRLTQYLELSPHDRDRRAREPVFPDQNKETLSFRHEHLSTMYRRDTDEFRGLSHQREEPSRYSERLDIRDDSMFVGFGTSYGNYPDSRQVPDRYSDAERNPVIRAPFELYPDNRDSLERYPGSKVIPDSDSHAMSSIERVQGLRAPFERFPDGRIGLYPDVEYDPERYLDTRASAERNLHVSMTVPDRFPERLTASERFPDGRTVWSGRYPDSGTAQDRFSERMSASERFSPPGAASGFERNADTRGGINMYPEQATRYDHDHASHLNINERLHGGVRKEPYQAEQDRSSRKRESVQSKEQRNRDSSNERSRNDRGDDRRSDDRSRDDHGDRWRNGNKGRRESKPEVKRPESPIFMVKGKTALSDSDVAVGPARSIALGQEMPPFIQRFMENAGKYKHGVHTISKTYKLPANCIGVTPPKLDTTAWDMLAKNIQTRDELLQDVHRWFAFGVIPILKQVNFFGKGFKIMKDVCRCTSDSLSVLNFVCSNLSVKRRLLLRHGLHRKYAVLCRRKHPVTKMLFGDNIANDLVSIKAGTFILPEAELKSQDPNNDDPEEKNFKPTFFAGLAIPGEEVDTNVATLINMACANDGDLSDLREKYKVVSNINEVIPPQINPEICSLLTRSTRELDCRLQDVHISIAEGMTPLMMLLQAVQQKNYDENCAIGLLTDCLLLMGNAMYQLNKVRLNAMKQTLSEPVHESCSWFWPGADQVTVSGFGPGY